MRVLTKYQSVIHQEREKKKKQQFPTPIPQQQQQQVAPPAQAQPQSSQTHSQLQLYQPSLQTQQTRDRQISGVNFLSQPDQQQSQSAIAQMNSIRDDIYQQQSMHYLQNPGSTVVNLRVPASPPPIVNTNTQHIFHNSSSLSNNNNNNNNNNQQIYRNDAIILTMATQLEIQLTIGKVKIQVHQDFKKKTSLLPPSQQRDENLTDTTLWLDISLESITTSYLSRTAENLLKLQLGSIKAVDMIHVYPEGYISSVAQSYPFIEEQPIKTDIKSILPINS